MAGEPVGHEPDVESAGEPGSDRLRATVRVEELPDLPSAHPRLIHDGDAVLVVEGEQMQGRGRCWFTTREGPEARYEFYAENPEVLRTHWQGDASLEIVGADDFSLQPTHEGALTRDSRRNPRGDGPHAEGELPPLQVGDGSSLQALRFHLINFGVEKAHPRMLEVNGWSVTLRRAEGQPLHHRYEITHVLDMSRTDGASFSYEEALEVRDLLFDTFAFAAGRVVGFALAQGRANGVPVFVDCCSTIADPWFVRRSWWDDRIRSTDGLQQLCDLWVAATSTERSKELFRRAARVYAVAVVPYPYDTAIPTAGSGLELMSWELLHQREQIYTTAEFGNLSFATRIRAALKHAGIPTEIPAECLALRRYVEGHEVPDGPTAFAECRNRLMHPPKKKRGWPPGDVMKEAWKLGVEYLALLILAALGYTGTYRSQIDYSGWAGSERPVPWAL